MHGTYINTLQYDLWYTQRQNKFLKPHKIENMNLVWTILSNKLSSLLLLSATRYKPTSRKMILQIRTFHVFP